MKTKKLKKIFTSVLSVSLMTLLTVTNVHATENIETSDSVSKESTISTESSENAITSISSESLDSSNSAISSEDNTASIQEENANTVEHEKAENIPQSKGTIGSGSDEESESISVENIPTYNGTNDIVLKLSNEYNNFHIQKISQIKIEVYAYGLGGNGNRISEPTYEYNSETGILVLHTQKGDWLQNELQEVWSWGEGVSLDLRLYSEDANGNNKIFDYNCHFPYTTESPAPLEIVLSENDTIVPIQKMQTLLIENMTKDIIIKTSNGVSFTFKKGEMKLINGKKTYDFGTNLITDFSQISNGFSTKDEFAFQINYNYQGELPGTANINIPIGKKWAGQTLYYYLIKDSKNYEFKIKNSVDKNGIFTVKQTHCSDYLATTKALDENKNTPNTDSSSNINKTTNTDSSSNINKTANTNSDTNKITFLPSTDSTPKTGDTNGVILYLTLGLIACFIVCATAKRKFIR